MATKKSSQHSIEATQADPVEPKRVKLSDKPPESRLPKNRDEQERAIEGNALPIEMPIGDFKPIRSKGKPILVEERNTGNDDDREEHRSKRRNH